MSRSELQNLERILTDNTVLEQLFFPLKQELSKVRYSAGVFRTLSMPLFCMLGFLRHLKGSCTMRKYLQQLLHLTDDEKMPLARSTWFDALNSQRRTNVLEQILPKLINRASKSLPDRLSEIPGLKNRPIYAVDGTYQQESAHYRRCTPSKGGTDNPKGHCLLPYFDVRLGIPVDVNINTTSASEIKILKEYAMQKDGLFRHRGALWLTDRGFVDCPFWDSLKIARDIEVITRIKENMIINNKEDKSIIPALINEGVESDQIIDLNASNQRWRLVTYKSTKGHIYKYLTNNFDLEPGVIAFLYLRRWDEEKCFDTWKNDFSQGKAWGKGVNAIRNQTILALITSVLVAIFVHEYQDKWGISDEKSLEKQQNRFDSAIVDAENCGKGSDTRPWYLLYFRSVSKISRQVLRFFESCFMKKASERLYEKQLRPMFMKYI